MPDYRAFRVGEKGGFVGVDEFEAPSDLEAMDRVLTLSIEHGYEVWSGSRDVGSINRTDRRIVFAPILDRATTLPAWRCR